MGKIDHILIRNFKSYEGEQKIGPFRRFTCVIGPNGSGKSNLMDAISFVLGVQTQQLRGAKLQDLVHLKEDEKGEETKRSAFVEIVFIDEEEHLSTERYADRDNEYRFRRSIRADGTGSYSLNGKTVNAKRYQQILKKIGILVKARNFLVFQGDVATIAQKSPEELTKMFEEISGSNTLSEEYLKAEEACETAGDDLMRTFTMKKSVNKEKKMVQEQKQEAERFQEMLDRLRESKSEFFLWQLFQAQKEIEENKEKKGKVEADLEDVKEEWEGAQKAIKDHSKESATMRRKILGLEKSITKRKRELDKAKPTRIKYSAQASGLKEGAKKAEKELRELERKGKAQDSKITSLKKQLKEIQREKKDFEAQSSSEENIIEASRMEEYNQKKQEVAMKTAQIQQDLDQVERSLGSKKKIQEKIEREIQVLKDAKTNNQSALEFNSKKKRKLEDHCKKNEEKLKQLGGSLKGLTQSSKNAAVRLTEVRKELEDADMRIHAARSDIQQSKHEVKKAECAEQLKRLFKGVRGRLYELCELTRKEYQTAVTVALGKNMEAMIVDEEKVAIDCIKYLKDQRLGKATFIPLDTIRVNIASLDSTRQFLKQRGGTFKLVYDVFKDNEAVSKALLYACATTLICDTESEAKAFCYNPSFRGKYKVVTRAGTIFHKSGNMSGGYSSKDKQRTNKWNEQEISKVQQKRVKLQAELLSLERKERTERDSREVNAQIEAAKQRLHFSTLDLKHSIDKLSKLETELKLTDKDLAQKNLALKKLQTEMAKDQKKIDAFKKNIAKVSVAVFADFSRSIGVKNIAEYEEKRLAAAEYRAKRKIELAEAESRALGALDYEQSRDSRALAKKLKKKIGALQKKLQEKEGELKGFDENIKTMKKDLKSDENELKLQKANMADRDTNIASVKKKNLELKKSISKLEREVMVLGEETTKLRGVRDDVQNQAKMEQVHLPLIGDRRKRKRGGREAKGAPGELDFDMLKNNRDVLDKQEYEQIKQSYLDKISDLQSTLQKLNPNMKAFDQFDDVMKRLSNMKSDFDRKRDGQELKQKFFDEILQKRTEMFRGVFDHVKKNIDSVYKALTKSRKHPQGGNAHLNLEDPEKPFLSGIKYTAMPPGKRWREMDQLSGGEKTVAALALLFAIHSCHPAPFFVLDEVDAALDGANVAKVSEYVRSRTKDDSLQCIVISLKDTFYHKADALVGIYKDQAKETSGSLTLDLLEYDSKHSEKKGKEKQATLSYSGVFGSKPGGDHKESGSVAASPKSVGSHRSRKSTPARSRKRTRVEA